MGSHERDARASDDLVVHAGRDEPVVGVKVDVQLIPAPHRDLEAGVKPGTCQEDFYYRLGWAVLERCVGIRVAARQPSREYVRIAPSIGTTAILAVMGQACLSRGTGCA
jgi:hypothetical protein